MTPPHEGKNEEYRALAHEIETCKADITTVTTAEEAYYAQNNVYAASTAALKAAGFLHSAPDTVAIAVTAAVVGPPAVPASVAVTGAAGASRDCTGVTV